jgi:hypothetical protein
MGPLCDGISHFAFSPEDVLPVVALAFLVGLRGKVHARSALAVLPPAWFTGGFVALCTTVPFLPALSVLTALLYLAIGGALAADAAVPVAGCAALSVLLGLVRGSADLAGVPAFPRNFVVLLGIAVSVFVVLALAASVTLPLRQVWAIVATRVSGSWLAALGLLLAGWIWRYGALVH